MSESQVPEPPPSSPSPPGGAPPPVGQPPPSVPVQSIPAGNPWWKRRAVLIAGTAIGAAGLLIGVVALVVSSSTRSDADEATAAVAQINSDISALDSKRDVAQQQYEVLRAATLDIDDAVSDFESSIDGSILTGDALLLTVEEHVALYNQGLVQQSNDLLNTQGVEDLQAFQAAVDTENRALSDLQAAVRVLQEEVADDG